MPDSDANSSLVFLALSDDALVAQCEVDHYRASGPGGQKRNKTSSGVRLRHSPTGLSVTAVDDRSQHVNRVRAVRRLREAIALHVRADIDTEAYRAGSALSECIDKSGRISVNRRNERYYPLVGEVLDVLAACQMRVSEAAELIDISTAHLVKFIGSDPKLWERVNQMRKAAGQKPLRNA